DQKEPDSTECVVDFAEVPRDLDREARGGDGQDAQPRASNGHVRFERTFVSLRDIEHVLVDRKRDRLAEGAVRLAVRRDRLHVAARLEPGAVSEVQVKAVSVRIRLEVHPRAWTLA